MRAIRIGFDHPEKLESIDCLPKAERFAHDQPGPKPLFGRIREQQLRAIASTSTPQSVTESTASTKARQDPGTGHETNEAYFDWLNQELDGANNADFNPETYLHQADTADQDQKAP